MIDSGSILNTIKDFIHHYPRVLFNDIPRVGAHFYDIPGSGRRFTTYPGQYCMTNVYKHCNIVIFILIFTFVCMRIDIYLMDIHYNRIGVDFNVFIPITCTVCILGDYSVYIWFQFTATRACNVLKD